MGRRSSGSPIPYTVYESQICVEGLVRRQVVNCRQRVEIHCMAIPKSRLEGTKFEEMKGYENCITLTNIQVFVVRTRVHGRLIN